MRPDGPRDPLAGPDSGPEPPFPIKLSGPVIKGFGRGSKELGIPTANIPPGPLDQYPDLFSGVYYGLVGLLLPSTADKTTTSSLSSSSSQEPTSTTRDDISTSTSTSSSSAPTPSIHPAVLSIGYNPFYANKTRSIEIHVLEPPLSYQTQTQTQASSPNSITTSPPLSSSSHPSQSKLPPNFYHAPLNLLILGFIRPEYDYVSKESLIEDILVDCRVARASLERVGYWYRCGDGEKGNREWGRWLSGFGWVDDVTGEGETEVKWEERVKAVEKEVGVSSGGGGEK